MTFSSQNCPHFRCASPWRQQISSLVSLALAAALVLWAGPPMAQATNPDGGRVGTWQGLPVFQTGSNPAAKTAAAVGSSESMTGQVRLANGKPAPAGTPVQLFADDPTGQAIGKTTTSQPVAVILTNAAGRFDIPVSAIPGARRTAGMMMRVMVVGSQGISHQLIGQLDQDSPVATGLSAPPPSGASPNLRETALNQPTISLTVQGAAPPNPLTNKQLAANTSCIGSVHYTRKASWRVHGIIGYTASETSNAVATFTFANAAKSSLGVGVSANDKSGTYKASRTVTVSSNATWTYPKQTGRHARAYRTDFVYSKYLVDYWCGLAHVSSYEVKPDSVAGGDYSYNTSWIPKPKRENCVAATGGMNFVKEESTAVTWSEGIDIKSMIGIFLTSQAGYTTKVSVAYKFSGKGNERVAAICGYKSAPSEPNPQLVFAEPASVLK
ncbi:MAG: hypothetical protein LBG70_02665 [Bifidobacteriaceae bacterium]|jgi:hypothetical protein|nr:hypothetical protein [Bifidobacteriaceae bacterium]